jgi:tRNA pseudouridine55 synthase
LRRIWSGPFKAEDGLTLDAIDAIARTEELDTHIQPLEVGLADLPMVNCPTASLTALRNGNPAMVIASGIDYGTEVWAAHEGRAVAVGRLMGSELHPARVFVD